MFLLNICWCFILLVARAVNGNDVTVNDVENCNSTQDVDTLSFERLRLYTIPHDVLKKYPCVKKLYLGGNRIRYITKDDFPPEAVKNLLYIGLHGNFINGIDPDAFNNMSNLIFIDLSRNRLKDVPIVKAPNLQKIYISRNQLKRISPEAMKYYRSIKHIELRYNDIEEISAGTFNKNKDLIYLDLDNNPLRKIHDSGLVGPKSLKYLHLKNTLLSEFPVHGISELETLEIRNIPNLFHLPKVSHFKHLKDIFVTYSMLCCPFRRRLKQIEASTGKIIQCNETNRPKPTTPPTTSTKANEATITIPSSENSTEVESWGGFSEEEMKLILDMFYGNDNETVDPCDPSYLDHVDLQKLLAELPKYHVNCQPEPDAFNPCEDVMGTDVLRAFSWIVSVFAVIGNIFQLVVLFHSKQKCVYKLLMYNLGFSNLLMGIYLLVLCCVDAYTYGEYYDFVQTWQYNGGCQGFGFLAVFSTSLSVCSLVLITLERFLLIVFALEAGYQMHIKHAKFCIAITWVYSLLVAILPATNLVSSYSKTAICLPMDVHEAVSEGYVVWLLVCYVLAFVLILYCYIRMYRLVKDVRPVGGNNTTIDTQVAKRMALIIFSNFLCWLPISFTGLLALYSGMIFNVNVAKFMIVFIFPLNACSNPFLYTIFTKIFREDTLDLLYKLRTRSRTSSDRSDRRDRSTSYLKSIFNGGSNKGRSASSTPMHLHVQPPSYEGNTYLNEHNIDTEETDFESPDTPIRSINDPYDMHKNMEINEADILSPEGEDAVTYDEIDNTKERSNSTRGLLEEYRQQEDITRNPHLTPNCQSISGTSLKSTNDINAFTTGDDEAFSQTVDNVNNADSSINTEEIKK